jgi:hypothetical protein
MRDEDEAGAEADYAVTVARQEERRRQGALPVLRECCWRTGAAVGELRQAERKGLDRAYDGPVRERIFAARRRLARAAAPALGTRSFRSTPQAVPVWGRSLTRGLWRAMMGSAARERTEP